MSPSSHVAKLRQLIGDRLGLRVDDNRGPVLAELLSTRARSLAGGDCAAYVEGLASGSYEQELAELARHLTVGETFFFRDPAQLAAAGHHLAERSRGGRRTLRILSAACSTGEEPYSLAMVAREYLGESCEVNVTAVDVNRESLARAADGRYSAWSLRQTPDPMRERYFVRQGKDFVLRADIQSMVAFQHRNLLDETADFWHGQAFDLVLCRNVLMYFVAASARRVVDSIARALVPGGLLLLGNAENLRGLSHDFRLELDLGTFYYRRKNGETDTRSAQPARSPRTPSPPTRKDSRRTSPRAARLAPSPLLDASAETLADASSLGAPTGEAGAAINAMQLVREERHAEALALLGNDVDGALDADRLLVRAVLLANLGNGAEAERACLHLLSLDNLNASAHYVMALCREHSGDLAEAVEHDQSAAYLDPDFAMPHLHLGLLAGRRGDTKVARRELELAASLLEKEDPSRVLLLGGGFDRRSLIELCRAELRACVGGVH